MVASLAFFTFLIVAAIVAQVLDEHEQAANLLRIHNTRQAEWSSNFEHELGELKQKAVANASGVQENKTSNKALSTGTGSRTDTPH